MEMLLQNLSEQNQTQRLQIATGLILLLWSAIGTAETLVAHRMDGSPIEIVVERPEQALDLPIVLFIDGSGCQSGQREGFQEFSNLPDSIGESSAKVIVEKPGVDLANETDQCTQTFLDYYTIDQRALDHLRAIQHLRRNASWWSGEIFLVGWSDGAMIGVSVAAFTPEITRAVFMALGGGIPMSRQFEDYILCAPDRTETRDACIENLDSVYADIRTNPSPNKTWLGDANTYKAWATRIDAVEYHVIKDLQIPILIVHGEKDRDSVPVESARELVRMLSDDGGVDFEYWEIPGAGHSVGIDTEGQSEVVRLAMFNWLFGHPSGEGGPPN